MEAWEWVGLFCWFCWTIRLIYQSSPETYHPYRNFGSKTHQHPVASMSSRLEFAFGQSDSPYWRRSACLLPINSSKLWESPESRDSVRGDSFQRSCKVSPRPIHRNLLIQTNQLLVSLPFKTLCGQSLFSAWTEHCLQRHTLEVKLWCEYESFWGCYKSASRSYASFRTQDGSVGQAAFHTSKDSHKWFCFRTSARIMVPSYSKELWIWVFWLRGDSGCFGFQRLRAVFLCFDAITGRTQIEIVVWKW